MRSVLLICIAVISGCGARTDLTCTVDGCDGSTGGSGTTDSTTLEDITIGDDTSGPFEDTSFVFDVPIDDLGVGDIGAPDTTPSTVCPSSLPKDGTACSSSLECEYVGCDLAKKDRASCVSGKWAVIASACAPASDRCPLALPKSGSSCALPDHTGCVWSTKCLADSVGWCVSGKWTIKGPTSCASAPSCPATMPPNGSKCSPPLECRYVNECGILESTVCDDGIWSGESYKCENDPACPTTEPVDGSKCTAIPGFPMCVWKNECGGVDYGRCGWILGAGTWTIFRPPCPASDCPTTPTEGSSCTKAGLSCTYPLGGSCTLVCSCSSGAWGCTQPPCSTGK